MVNGKYTKARFHVIVTTQINKSVVYFMVRHNGVPNANQCANFDVKSGLMWVKLNQCILVDSSTITCWISLFVI